MTLPLSSYPMLTAGGEVFKPGDTRVLGSYFLDWLSHPNYDEYWKRWSINDNYEKITVPAYNVAAWYDIFQGGTFRNYQGLTTLGGTAATRNGQRLLVMIGGHSGHGRKIGDVDFGPQAEIDVFDVLLRWYDHLLKGIDNGIGREKPVKIFVMGKNVWREEAEWPLARARHTRYYLHSPGNANSVEGGGSLSPTAPEMMPPDRFVYDPAEPVPTRGGPLCCDWADLEAGPIDQRPNEARSDVLIYTTPSFLHDFEVTGPVTLEVYVSSSAVDTDITAKLVDVWPSGFAQNLTEGIVRCRYRNSPENPEFMNPGEIYKLRVDLWSTCNVFLAGHKLRLEIASSNFPRFDRNLNTGELAVGSTQMIKATNTVYHDRARPSALILPVIPHGHS